MSICLLLEMSLDKLPFSGRNLLSVNATFQLQHISHLCKILIRHLSDRLYFKGWCVLILPLAMLGFTPEWVCPPALIHVKHVGDDGGPLPLY